MEEFSDYLRRFINNPEMKELFPRYTERREMAVGEFGEKWLVATATVTLANGNKYFID